METTFEIPKLRRGHRVDVGDATCYWFEMDHAGEGSKSLLDIFDQYLNQYHWDQFIRPGSTVVDIGGHSGDTAVPMQFVARGTVLAVEPNPVIRPYLDFCCNMNGHLGKFIVAGEAVTTEDLDAVDILDHNNNLCNGGLIDKSWTPNLQDQVRAMAGKKVTVPGLTLEHLLNKYLTEDEINNISFLKTDTEGHDVSILESSRDLIDRIRPVIFTEWFWLYGPTEVAKMFRVIADMNYSAFDPITLKPATMNQRCEDLILIHNTKLNDYNL